MNLSGQPRARGEGGAAQQEGAPAPAVARAVHILEYLANVRPEAGVTEIATALGINKSTCFNILRTLSASAIVVRDARYPVYRLGPKLVELATASRRNFSRGDAVKRLLRPLVDELGSTCLLGQPLPGYGGVVVIDRLVPRRDGVLSAPIGHTYPITAPAMGRAVLAAADFDVVLEPADLGLRSGVELERFLASLDHVRAVGYAASVGEYQPGVNAVAAVVRGSDGGTIMVLCLIADEADLPEATIHAAGPRLVALARRVASELEGSESA